jgi:hypothetical protein
MNRKLEALDLDAIEKEDFIAYERVRMGACTNMFDTPKICALANSDDTHFLSPEAARGVRKNYLALCEKWPDVRNNVDPIE